MQSHPHRLRVSGNLLRPFADAEIFAGGLHRFHDQPEPEETAGTTGPRWDGYWGSNVPRPGVGFFLLEHDGDHESERPMFDMLRGFGSDYGDLDCNKCGLDTEFCWRAYYAGARFAISKERSSRITGSTPLRPQTIVSLVERAPQVASRGLLEAENVRRFADFQRGAFDPRVFSALRSRPGLTERVKM